MRIQPRFFSLIAAFLMWTTFVSGQTNTQTIRGMVYDAESRAHLAGATIKVFQDSSIVGGAISDAQGRYRVENVPVGRIMVLASYLGYEPWQLPNIQISSGKELVMEIKMTERIVELEGVEILSGTKESTINDMATVSARTFSIEEADRYAGSRGDPARMASNFAGVRGADDSRNDIIVRGNTPLGVVYRMEGIDIPNPNHFSMIGMTGGPVGVLNNKVLSNSDFFTGAFPAEYGNGIAAVFDLNLRNGNNEKYEFTGQLGLLGAEALIEGPISKEKRSSFFVNYRYSTIAIMEAMGINFGIAALPRYQDLSFKLNFPGAGGSNVSVFGLAGKSDITIANSERDTTDIFDTQIGKDIRFGSRLGVLGANYFKTVGKSAWIKASVYTSMNFTYTEHDSINDLNLPVEQQVPGLFMRMKYHNWRVGTAVMYNHKLSARHTLRAGLHIDRINSMGIDSSRYLSPTAYQLRADFNETAFFARIYAQLKYKITQDLTMNAGLHGQMFFLNNSKAVEPRLGFRWQAARTHSFSLGYGLHHQLQPLHVYYQELPDAAVGDFVQQDMDFTRSHHLVGGWDWRIGQYIRAKAEIYYQRLSRIPIEVTPSAFSMVNLGSNFNLIRPDTVVVNEGTGRNYGMEFTLEKFFSKGYFFLVTGSLYESKYTGSDGVERDTDFNGNYGLNVLAGKEFTLGKKKNTVLGLSANTTWAGGRRYAPIDLVESRRIGEYVGLDSLTNTLQLKDYFRADLRISLRLNGKSVSHEIAFDGVNILNLANELGLMYDPIKDEARIIPQLNFFPILYYRIEF